MNRGWGLKTKRVPDDAAFARKYQEVLSWVSGDEVEPPAHCAFLVYTIPSPGLGVGGMHDSA